MEFILYDVGINWMWIIIFKDGYLARFRSHLDEKITYEILNMFDDSNKYITENSGLNYGGKTVKGVEYESTPVTDKLCMAVVFKDLRGLLEKHNGNSRDPFDYIGVEFKKLNGLPILK